MSEENVFPEDKLSEDELSEDELSEAQLQEQHLQYCSGSSPFCFNKKRGRREVIEVDCKNQIYTPIIALNGILALKQRELQKTINVAYTGISQNKTEQNKFCSPLDNAWFIIIDDILLRLSLGQKLLSGEKLSVSEDPSLDPNLQTRAVVENLNNSAPPINVQKQAIDLVEILKKLIEICKVNWEVTEIVPIESHPDYPSCLNSKDNTLITNDIRCTSVLALNILSKLKNDVLENQQFKLFSKKLKDSIQNSEETFAALLKGKLPAAEGPSEQSLPEKTFSEQITEIFSTLTSFFQMCKHLFNRKDSLYGGLLYNEIQSTITSLTNSLNIFFSPSQNLTGGRRCTRRRVTNKKCKKKISYKKCSSYKKNTQYYKQRYNKKTYYTKRFPKKKSMRRYKKTLKGGLGGVLDKIWSGVKGVATGISYVVKVPATISLFFGGFVSSFGWVPAGGVIKVSTYIFELIFTKKHDLYLDDDETDDAIRLAVRELLISNPLFFSMFLIWGYRYDFTFNRLVRTRSKALEYAVEYQCTYRGPNIEKKEEKKIEYNCKKVVNYVLEKSPDVTDENYQAKLINLKKKFNNIDEENLKKYMDKALEIEESLKFPSNVDDKLDEIYTYEVPFSWMFEEINKRASYGNYNNER